MAGEQVGPRYSELHTHAVVLVVAERFYRVRAMRQDADRLVHLLERYEKTTESTERHQQTAAAELSDVRTRIDSIERMLREVG